MSCLIWVYTVCPLVLEFSISYSRTKDFLNFYRPKLGCLQFFGILRVNIIPCRISVMDISFMFGVWMFYSKLIVII